MVSYLPEKDQLNLTKQQVSSLSIYLSMYIYIYILSYLPEKDQLNLTK